MLTHRSEQETVDRLSLLLVLDTYRYPFQKNNLINFIIENEILKYFEMHQLLSTLIESQLIEELPEEEGLYYQLTENGRVSLAFFKDRMPIDLQNTIIDLVSIIPVPNQYRNEVQTSFEQIDADNYEVHLELLENQKSLMSLSLNVISQQQAEQIINKWEKDTEYLYGDIIQLLIKETPNRS